MLTILASSQTGMHARQMLERKPPQWASIWSSSTSLLVLRRPTSGLDSSSAMISSIGRPFTPPALLIRSTAICTPTSAVLPPAAPAPDRGLIAPTVGGSARPKATRHGAATSMTAPIAPPPQPTPRRRVTLPPYQKSCAQSSSFHFSLISLPPSGSDWFRSTHAPVRESLRNQHFNLEKRQFRPHAHATARVKRNREGVHRTPMPDGMTRHCQSSPAGPWRALCSH